MDNYPLAEINLDALHHNLHIVQRYTASKIFAVVKGNAYGHGLLPIAKTLVKNHFCQWPGVNCKGADGLAVARLEEALQLRENGISIKILVMEGFLTKTDLQLIDKYKLDIAVHSEWQIELLEKFNSTMPISAWLYIDVGLHQFGLLPSQVSQAYQRLLACTSVQKPLRFMTHFSHASEPGNPITLQQWSTFAEITRDFKGELSSARSSALLAFPETTADWVRPGFILYGYCPFNKKSLSELKGKKGLTAIDALQSVMTLKSKVIAIKKLKSGTEIGYGGTWICPEDMRIAIVSIGYGDGYPRTAKPGTPIIIQDKTLPLIGRVCMDKITVDLRGTERIKIGDEVILWGKELPLSDVADFNNIAVSDLLCRLTDRVKKQYYSTTTTIHNPLYEKHFAC